MKLESVLAHRFPMDPCFLFCFLFCLTALTGTGTKILTGIAAGLTMDNPGEPHAHTTTRMRERGVVRVAKYPDAGPPRIRPPVSRGAHQGAPCC